MTGANVTGNGLLNWNDNNENVPGTELFTGAATTGCEPGMDLNLKKALSFLMIGMPIPLISGAEKHSRSRRRECHRQSHHQTQGRLGIEANVSTSYIHGKPEPQIKGGLGIQSKVKRLLLRYYREY